MPLPTERIGLRIHFKNGYVAEFRDAYEFGGDSKFFGLFAKDGTWLLRFPDEDVQGVSAIMPEAVTHA